MMDWTDRHCRFFLRQFSPRVLLYTEMITAAAILRGDRARLLQFSPAEQPVALQLGGSNPADLATAARAGEDAGYREINLNCGCPSDRVSSGSFGACLMETPDVVAECVAAMCAAVSIPVTVKMRIGVVNRHRRPGAGCQRGHAALRRPGLRAPGRFHAAGHRGRLGRGDRPRAQGRAGRAVAARQPHGAAAALRRGAAPARRGSRHAGDPQWRHARRAADAWRRCSGATA